MHIERTVFRNWILLLLLISSSGNPSFKTSFHRIKTFLIIAGPCVSTVRHLPMTSNISGSTSISCVVSNWSRVFLFLIWVELCWDETQLFLFCSILLPRRAVVISMESLKDFSRSIRVSMVTTMHDEFLVLDRSDDR